jgi:hypothetical protein
MDELFWSVHCSAATTLWPLWRYRLPQDNPSKILLGVAAVCNARFLNALERESQRVIQVSLAGC